MRREVVTTLVRTLCDLGSSCLELLFELLDASFLGLCCTELLLLLRREVGCDFLLRATKDERTDAAPQPQG